MLNLFSSLLGEQHSQLTTSRERLLNGLTKLHDTNAAVDGMQKELTALQPTLQQKTASAELLLAQVQCSILSEDTVFFDRMTANVPRNFHLHQTPSQNVLYLHLIGLSLQQK